MGDDRGPNRGMFGYEGEGFMRDGEDYDDVPPRPHSDDEPAAARGWNIGSGDHRRTDEEDETK